MNKTNLILASVLAILFTSILIIFSPSSQKTPLSSPTPSPISTESISPTPDPTTSWKTYENKEYGFEFKCPTTSTYEIMNLSKANGIVLPYSQESCFEGQNQISISVYKIINQEVFTLDGKIKELSGASLKPLDFKDTFLGQNKMITYKEQNQFDQIEDSVSIIILDDKYIRIRGFSENYYNQILSTFKFTDKTNCWQNDQLKISFDLPNNNWQCDSENEWMMNLNSDLFTIRISNLGRGPYCFDDVNEPNNPCIVKPFLLNDKYTFDLYTFMGENKEIFGDLRLGNGTWVSIKYNNMETKSLTSGQKQELSQLFNSLKNLP